MIHNQQTPMSSPEIAATAWFPVKLAYQPLFEKAASDGAAKALSDEDKIWVLLNA